ncbi:hypothetical protein K438DRAFT_1930481 [Mycena galopus ATCC 62051]|nr:hypothetical protein K438DRAFT_1930481 [Mycena galopus ATCC 62051]
MSTDPEGAIAVLHAGARRRRRSWRRIHCFDRIVANNIALGVYAFLEAALGMESGLMGEAARLHALSEAGAKKAAAGAGVNAGRGGGVAGTHAYVFRIVHGLLPMHLTKLYKTVFPAGLDGVATIPDSSPASSVASTPARAPAPAQGRGGRFGRWGVNGEFAIYGSPRRNPNPNPPTTTPKTSSGQTANARSGSAPRMARWRRGCVCAWLAALACFVPGTELRGFGFSLGDVGVGATEYLLAIYGGAGFGLFNLVFSLLPKKVQ